ncbi:hypothetical protein HYU18_03675 [Candidatus Woesearchaeota archaeon]|nr:hypothetical protein [Candidatus Woesearchaeota archaeon]
MTALVFISLARLINSVVYAQIPDGVTLFYLFLTIAMAFVMSLFSNSAFIPAAIPLIAVHRIIGGAASLFFGSPISSVFFFALWFGVDVFYILRLSGFLIATIR